MKFSILIISLTIVLSSCFLSDPSFAQNHVLSLDGLGDYVRLPADSFNQLTEATVEGWVRWEKLSQGSRFFDFGEFDDVNNVNNRLKIMAVAGDYNPNNLQFYLTDEKGQGYKILVAGILSEKNWIHIAAVSGKGGMKLYVNGALVGENPYEGSFSRIGSGLNNYLGMSNWAAGEILYGQIDEFRVWSVAKTEKQIRSTMFTSLKGDEPNLVGYWQFELDNFPLPLMERARVRGKQVFDSTKNGYHGEMFGDAKLVAMELPQSLSKPAVLSGVVSNVEGNPVSGAIISLRQDDEEIISIQTDEGGRYQIALLSFGEKYDLYATSENLGDLKEGISIRAHGMRPYKEGERQTINLTLREAVSISGRLWMLDNTSTHSGVLVQAIREGKVYAYDISDDEGKYRFVNLKPGRYQARCRIPGKDIYYSLRNADFGLRIEKEELKEKIRNPQSAIRIPQFIEGGGKTLQVQGGKTLSGIDFRFAPFKKGTWTTFNLLDGLPSNRVSAIHIDKQGYPWIGTWSGLSRFDGKEFINYTAKDGLANDSVSVSAIYEDRRGYIWFGTGKSWSGDKTGEGVLFYELDKHGLGKFLSYTQRDGLVHNTVLAIAEDLQGNLWFGTLGGVSRFDGKKFVNYTTKDGLASNWVQAIHLDRKGNLWFGTNGGVSRFDGKSFFNYTTQDGLVHNNVLSISEDQQGNLWFGTYGGVSRYDGKEFVSYTQKDGLVGDHVSCIHLDRQGNLWFGTGLLVGEGISRFDGIYFVNFTVGDGLADNRILTINEDQHGYLWVGTVDKGISRFNENGFVNYTEQDGLGSNKLMSVYVDRQGRIWLGTDGGGASRFDGKEFITYTQQDGLADNGIWAIDEDQQGHLWFGSLRSSVSRYDGKNFVRYTAKDGFRGYWVLSIHRDRQGNLWFSSLNGVSRYDGKKFINYTTKDGLAQNSIWSIGEDRQGHLWFGTWDGGVSRFDGKNFVNYTTENGLVGNKIHAIHADQRGFLWLASIGEGISRYDGKNFVNYTTEDGLASNLVSVIQEDRNRHLWFGTAGGGVVHYDGIAFQSLDTRDGLADNLVTGIAEDGDGLIWFATAKGATRYRRNPTPPQARIIALTTDQRYTDFSQLKPVSPGTRFTIEYTSIDFKTHKDKRLYRYKLEGYDDDWRKPTKQTAVDYSKLKPGKYTFMLQAIDRDLNYSKPATIQLQVKHPWGLYALLIGTIMSIPLGFAGYHFGIRLQTKRAIAQSFNPYIAGKAVPGDMFFGRSDLVSEIQRTLANNCFLLYGERRIGKTSILHYLRDYLPKANDPNYEYIPVFIDLQGVSEDRFFSVVGASLIGSCRLYLSSDVTFRYSDDAEGYSHRDLNRDLRTIIEHLTPQEEKEGKKIKIVLLMDEVDALNSFSLRTNLNLRGLFMGPFREHLVLVMSGLYLKMDWSDQGEGSPPFNFLSREIRLEPLSETDARKLIEEPVKGFYSYEREAVDLIIKYSECKPFTIQAFCLRAVNRILADGRRKISAEDIEKIREAVLAEVASIRGERPGTSLPVTLNEAISRIVELEQDVAQVAELRQEIARLRGQVKGE